MSILAPSPAAESLAKANELLLQAWMALTAAADLSPASESLEIHELIRRIDVIQEHVSDLEYSGRVKREYHPVAPCICKAVAR